MESTSLTVIVFPTTPSVVEMRGAPPSTITFSLTEAGSRVKSITIFWLRLSSRVPRTTVLKPGRVAVTL